MKLLNAGLLGIVFCCVSFSAGAGEPASPRACQIKIVEQASGWPIPMVELRTTHNVRLVSDNAGIICFDLPELFGREVWFDVSGHGYEVPKDGFGYRGVRLTPKPGETLTVTLQRKIVARRLGRLTGAGIFGESQKIGLEPGIAFEPVLGCDSVQNTVHRGRLFWLWGDTTLAKYPLGIFNCTAATTTTTPLESFAPPLRLKYEFLKDTTGAVRGIADISGEGPTWLSGVVSLPDNNGEPRLVATYAKIKPPLEAYEWGLTEWDETAQCFQRLRRIWHKDTDGSPAPRLPDGHAVFWTDADGTRWVLFGDPFPFLRCRATYEAWQNTNEWVILAPQAELVTMSESSTGAAVKPHRGSIAWNSYRKRWVTIFTQLLGKPSAFGEIWYAESRTPFGPWGPAVKVLSHEDYTFYNPRIHPEFTEAGDPRLLLFEGTFSVQFSGNRQPTPRYDYNQILYRLDLDDPALAPARRPDLPPHSDNGDGG